MNSSKCVLETNSPIHKQLQRANGNRKQQPLTQKQELQNQPHKFLAFLHRQKDNHISLRTSSPIAERKNKKKDKQGKDFKNNHIDALRNAILPHDKITPNAQSKWIVEHIDYLNKIGIYSPGGTGKSRPSVYPLMPQYRHFGDTKPSTAKLGDAQADQQQIIYRYLQSKKSEDIVARSASSPKYALSNATKDTGFGSMGGDQGTTLRKQYISRNFSNDKRANLATVDALPHSPTSPYYRKNRAAKQPNNNKSNDRSSNISSSDSMEQEIIHSKNHNQSDSMSYLGPFNFRQLLRPTQGPTDSLRKRKGNFPLTPPPLQKGKV